MNAIIIDSLAADDIDRAFAWYEQRRLGLGIRFHDALSGTLDAIATRPRSFPVFVREGRRALLDRFPYAVHFREEAGRCLVIAVLHTSRDREQVLRERT